ncbi:MAG: bifunctional oligoribonuclease/PAP phosphatase NrnA [Anaerolineae bacterium]|nr:bifunctional oligoribonuclease/PAP phosphatase NrnA [Anaerolineae bacterium]
MTTNKNTTLKQASQLIRSAHRPLLICHIAPDGDAIGSLTGLGRALRHEGLEPIMACSDPVPARFNYIPYVGAIVQDVSASFDLVISLDCSDLKRLGHFPQMPTFRSVPLLNIDHHLTNLDFGDVNLVDPHASSTAEIVLRLLEYMALPLDAELATCLLTGIVADTRGLRTSNVTIQVMDAALRLMKAGASLPYVTHHTLDRRPTTAIRLWGATLAQLHIEDRVIWTSIPLAMRRTAGYAGNGDAGLVSFLVSGDDADVAVVFVEREDSRIEVSLRAVPGFDVAQVALQLGGGGHALAAGCNLPGPLEEAQARVLAALRADLARQRHT